MKIKKSKTVEKKVETKPRRAHSRVIVEGVERRLQCFNLPHEIYCEEMGVCSCSVQQVASSVYSKADQEKHLTVKDKRVNASITVGYRKKIAVPQAALLCPEVKAAIDQKRLRVRS